MVENVPLVGIHKTHIFSSKESDGHTWTIKKERKIRTVGCADIVLISSMKTMGGV
jgi:hypothetical protein